MKDWLNSVFLVFATGQGNCGTHILNLVYEMAGSVSLCMVFA